MKILAIDPGTTESGWCVYDTVIRRLLNSGVLPNDVIRSRCTMAGITDGVQCVAIERFEPRGMAVGLESLEAIYWSGRFAQAWNDDDTLHRVFRRTVKLHLCGSAKAKDANIRQALIDLLGPPGTKKNPGPTFGVKSHAWAALAVAVTVADTILRPEARAA